MSLSRGRFRTIERESEWESDDLDNQDDEIFEAESGSELSDAHRHEGDAQDDSFDSGDHRGPGETRSMGRGWFSGFALGRNDQTAAVILAVSTLLLSAIGVFGFRDGIERKLESSTLQALVIDNHREVAVSASGRDITLRGLVASPDALQQVKRLAKNRPGVRSVDVSDVLVVGGTDQSVGADAGNESAVESAASDQATNAEESTVATGTGDPALPMKKPIVDANFSSGSVEVRGITPDSDARDSIVAPLASALGVALTTAQSQTTIAPAEGQRLLGNNVEVNLAPTERADMPAYRRLGQFLQLLARTNYSGSVRYDRGAMVMDGMVPLAADRVLIEAQAKTLIGGGSLTLNLNPLPSDTALELASTVPSATPTTVANLVTTTVSESDLRVAQESIDASISGRTIEFEKEKATLSEAGKTVVKELAQAVKGLPNQALLITIAGYTDDRGSESSNLKLSQKRADAVAAQLVVEGLSSTQLKAEGRGEADPIASNDTEDGRTQNRRIEIRVSQ